MFDPERIAKGLWWDAALRVNSGCTKVSPGCDHCWAESELKIRSNSPNAKIAAQWPGNFQGDVRLLPDNLEKVIKARTPKAWSVWNDLFHKDVPDEYRDRVLGAFAVAHEQLGIILTKRADQMAEYFTDTDESRCAMIANAADLIAKKQGREYCPIRHLPLDNIWLGTSAEDQERLAERILHLLQCLAAVRFLSLEPLLGPMDLVAGYGELYYCSKCGYCGDMDRRRCVTCGGHEDDDTGNCLPCGEGTMTAECPKCQNYSGHHSGEAFAMVDCYRDTVLPGLGWVIVGAESRGGGAGRECKIEWVSSIVAQCKAAGVPVFVKQLHIDGKLVKDIEKFPDDLRLRQVPTFNI